MSRPSAMAQGRRLLRGDARAATCPKRSSTWATLVGVERTTIHALSLVFHLILADRPAASRGSHLNPALIHASCYATLVRVHHAPRWARSKCAFVARKSRSESAWKLGTTLAGTVAKYVPKACPAVNTNVSASVTKGYAAPAKCASIQGASVARSRKPSFAAIRTTTYHQEECTSKKTAKRSSRNGLALSLAPISAEGPSTVASTFAKSRVMLPQKRILIALARRILSPIVHAARHPWPRFWILLDQAARIRFRSALSSVSRRSAAATNASSHATQTNVCRVSSERQSTVAVAAFQYRPSATKAMKRGLSACAPATQPSIAVATHAANDAALASARL